MPSLERKFDIKTRSIIEHMDQGYSQIAIDGSEVYINPALLKILGYQSVGEYSGKTFINHCLEPSVVSEFYRNITKSRQTNNIELQVITSDGAVKWLSIHAYPVIDGDQYLYTDSFFQDISHQKNSEFIIPRQLPHVLETICKSTQELLGTSSWVSLYDPKQHPRTVCSPNLSPDFCHRFQLVPRKKLDEYLKILGDSPIFPDVQVLIDNHQNSQLYAENGIRSVIYFPIIDDRQKISGVLCAASSGRTYHFSEEDLLLLRGNSDYCAQAIFNSKLQFQLNIAQDSTLESLSSALDLRDKETKGHSQRVAQMAVALGITLGLSEKDQEIIRRGSLLHDIGKIGIPDSVLSKSSSLTPEEWQIMRQHPDFAYKLLKQIPYLSDSLNIPYCHHERWDGNGYPRGLRGEQIPIEARIFALVDNWDALCSDRPYRKKWSPTETLVHIQSLSGNYLDPNIVDIFTKEYSQGNLSIFNNY